MTEQSLFNIFAKTTIGESYMSIRMHITEMACNGRFMTIRMYVPYRFMKQVDIYFLEQAMSMSVALNKDMGIHLICRSMPSPKTIRFYTYMKPPLRRLPNFANRSILVPKTVPVHIFTFYYRTYVPP